jgi:hypothetical protein
MNILKIFPATTDSMEITTKPAPNTFRIVLHLLICSLGGGSGSGHWHISLFTNLYLFIIFFAIFYQKYIESE